MLDFGNLRGFFDDFANRWARPKPVTHEVEGQHYTIRVDGTLGEPVRQLAPQWQKPVLEVGTLSGLVEIYKSNIDGFTESGKAGINIVDYRTVELVSLEADSFGRRHVWARAKHKDEFPFEFNKYETSEKFLINFRASFLFNDNAVKVQKVCSTLSADNSVAVSDDGMSQSITVNIGAVTKSTVELPADGIPLIPWRTFRDANPVESKFLLRMKNVKDDLPLVALFEIDAMWKLDTVHSIQHYFKKHLPEATVIA